jgi:hypothetical protein
MGWKIDHHTIAVAALLVVFAALAIFYSFIIPPGEGVDDIADGRIRNSTRRV